MFKKFLVEIAKAETDEELNEILYGIDGVDMAYQREKISWKDHEILFALVGKHKACKGIVAACI